MRDLQLRHPERQLSQIILWQWWSNRKCLWKNHCHISKLHWLVSCMPLMAALILLVS